MLNRRGLRFSYIRHQDILDPFGFLVRRAARIVGLTENGLQRRRPVRVLWSIYLLFIYYPILAGGILLRKVGHYNVVCDRYIYDTMVGFRDYGEKIPLENLLLRLVPHPDVSFVLEAPDERILSNRPEHSAQFIRMEKYFYAQIAERFNLERVSTANPKSIVWSTIVAKVMAVMGVGPSSQSKNLASMSR